MDQDSSIGEALHKEYPKRFSRTDFWRQIKRTVNGQPVSERDIEQIVAQVGRHLALCGDDHLLDLGCGNGALASEFFDGIDRYTGVDFSSYLLEIAGDYFQPSEAICYIQSDIRWTDRYLSAASGATKVLIYGCMGYLQPDDFLRLIAELKSGLPSLKTLFIGNIADRDKAGEFFAARGIDDFDLDDPQSAIGVWWNRKALIQTCQAVGYHAEVTEMPSDFYSSRYRFDLVIHHPSR
ncbi:class I SAM-dependent methyltransferase [Stieleria varia]|uniref:Methyltransferase domain-containing protein n=1 Tax=Stieleria varia TaxID=2528005 RepID=A0A5C6B0D0_9BACT|nr:class I SAM-dependent methyltransferase [Stieleria varia]TWU05755.1 hypothetical protein Pla52n_14700 [Stieleria varia]